MAKRHATPFINQNLFICVVVLLLLPMADEGAKVYDNARSLTSEEKRLTREYHLRQGAIRGLIVKPGRQYDLQHVEMFLGIPYAAPPIGRLRFMPPVSAPPWPGVKMATRFAPVCPQALPQIKKENPPSPGRQEYLKRLRPFLAHESEDCLYLNIYVPYREQKSKKFPVLVFIHGDSFEWSSGNPYDGRILASYGNVMVITLNFRLGILGFMKPSHTEHNYGNNGLLDQMAALQWIKDNIQDLNGDPNSITLMGHGTGAACVSYLMMSHICDAKELFHRAILMSGSALSDWAITKDPTPYTMQVAQSLGCNPTAKNMMECMQRKPLSEIKKVQILAREFETPLGPAVLGAIISEPEKTLESFPYLLSKYQLLSGVTEMESYHDFYNIELTSGMLEKQRDEFISKYAKIVFDVITGAEHEALKEILKQYSPSKQDPQQWTVETNRDVVLNLFSDARTLAPMISFANYQCKANRQSYFYVFGHNSVSTEYAHLNKSIHGEEMPYVLGIPLGGANSHFHSEYTQNEKLLSEFIMRLWTNFVKNGSPNTQSVNEYQTFDKRQWSLYNVEWPEYNVEHQPYLRIDMPPYISSLYRSNYTKFWIDTLPKKMSRYMVDPLFQFTPAAPTTQRPKPAHAPPQHRTADPIRRMWAPSVAGPTHYSSVPYGVLRPYSPPEQHSGTNDIYRQIQSIKTPSRYVPPNLMEKGEAAVQTTPKPTINLPVKTSSATITLIISLAVLFLAVNIAICAILYFKKRRLRQERSSQAPQPRAEIGEVDVIGQKSSKDDKSALQSLKNGYSVIRSMSIKKMRSNSKKAKKEVCKTPKSDDSGGFRERFQLRRHLSTSTLDAHTKVRDWIANEVMHRCSPGILRKSNSDLNEKALSVAKPYTRSEELLSNSKRSKNEPSNVNKALSPNLHTHKKTNLSKHKTSEKTTSTSALGSHSSVGSNKQSFISKNTEKSNDSLRSKESESSKSKKVSVAIDATPAARTNSILNQEPIEISKSFDSIERQHSGVDNKLQRSKTENDSSKDIIEIRPTKNEEQKIFTNVVTLSLERDRPLKISHKHSVSDPVSDVNYDLLMKQMQKDAEIANILPPITFRNDVNMTSRDDKISLQPLSAEESLLTIKKRNFPKVLPDLPKAQKRLSLQPTSLQSFRGYIGNVESQFDRPKVPPQPPPRTTTLERRLAYKNSKPLSSFDASNMNKIPESKNYENIDSLSPYSEIHKSSNRSFETPSSSSDKSRTGAVTKDREYPKVIIASSDMASTPEPKILITLSPSQVDIPTNVPRVRLPDDFHSQTTGSITSFSSLCSDEELDDEIDEEQLDDIAEDKLINELVGGVESPTERYVLDSKGPATIFEKQLEIVPVKLNTVRVQPRSMEDYVCVSDLRLPDVSDLEKTAQIKPNFRLNKLSHRSESIHRPPEKAIKIKQKRTLKPTLLNRGSKSSRSGSGKSSDFSSLEHSNSGSSNDTETSTGTVKKVDFK